ncbi:MAG: hypothetical protein ACR2PK_01330 [Acidimicrobiales bacterium]
MRVLVLVAAALMILAGCSDDSGSSVTQIEAEATPTSTPPAADENSTSRFYPDVIAATADVRADGTWSFEATLSSPYDSPQQYADAWRVLTPDGDELGIRILTHHHATEQPFTRSLAGVAVPGGVLSVTIEGRDLINGWGGETVEVTLEREPASG